MSRGEQVKPSKGAIMRFYHTFEAGYPAQDLWYSLLDRQVYFPGAGVQPTGTQIVHQSPMGHLSGGVVYHREVNDELRVQIIRTNIRPRFQALQDKEVSVFKRASYVSEKWTMEPGIILARQYNIWLFVAKGPDDSLADMMRWFEGDPLYDSTWKMSDLKVHTVDGERSLSAFVRGDQVDRLTLSVLHQNAPALAWPVQENVPHRGMCRQMRLGVTVSPEGNRYYALNKARLAYREVNPFEVRIPDGKRYAEVGVGGWFTFGEGYFAMRTNRHGKDRILACKEHENGFVTTEWYWPVKFFSTTPEEIQADLDKPS